MESPTQACGMCSSMRVLHRTMGGTLHGSKCCPSKCCQCVAQEGTFLTQLAPVPDALSLSLLCSHLGPAIVQQVWATGTAIGADAIVTSVPLCPVQHPPSKERLEPHLPRVPQSGVAAPPAHPGLGPLYATNPFNWELPCRRAGPAGPGLLHPARSAEAGP